MEVSILLRSTGEEYSMDSGKLCEHVKKRLERDYGSLMDQFPLVSIIIPNFNGKPFIEKCLRSVLDTDYPMFEVIVVDDGSTDGSTDLIKEKFSCETRLRVIRNKRNMGTAAARNVGIKAARGEVLCFIDNDAQVDPNWLKESVKILCSRQDIGAVECLLLDMDRVTVLSAGFYLSPYFGWVFSKGIFKDSNDVLVNDKPIDQFGDVLALCVRKDLIESIGGFDELLVHNVDHVDLLWRIWLTGHRVVLAPKARAYHPIFKPQKSRRRYISSLNWNFHFSKIPYIFIKNYEFNNILWYMPWAVASIILRGILNLARNDPYPLIGGVKALLWNIVVLKTNINERRRVQSFVRKVPDSYVIKRAMVPNLLSYIRFYRETKVLQKHFLSNVKE
jgi:GT2 family glycosyltransferase